MNDYNHWIINLLGIKQFIIWIEQFSPGNIKTVEPKLSYNLLRWHFDIWTSTGSMNYLSGSQKTWIYCKVAIGKR